MKKGKMKKELKLLEQRIAKLENLHLYGPPRFKNGDKVWTKRGEKPRPGTIVGKPIEEGPKNAWKARRNYEVSMDDNPVKESHIIWEECINLRKSN